MARKQGGGGSNVKSGVDAALTVLDKLTENKLISGKLGEDPASRASLELARSALKAGANPDQVLAEFIQTTTGLDVQTFMEQSGGVPPEDEPKARKPKARTTRAPVEEEEPEEPEETEEEPEEEEEEPEERRDFRQIGKGDPVLGNELEELAELVDDQFHHALLTLNIFSDGVVAELGAAPSDDGEDDEDALVFTSPKVPFHKARNAVEYVLNEAIEAE